SPDMRELKLTGEELLDDAFAAELSTEVERLAQHCRFRDCRHQAEPGCAIRAALADGTLDAQRYAHTSSWNRSARRPPASASSCSGAPPTAASTSASSTSGGDIDRTGALCRPGCAPGG